MKNYLLLVTVLFVILTTVCHAQTKTVSKKGTYGVATGDYKPNRQVTPQGQPKSPTATNATTYQNDCYKSLAFTVKNYGFNKGGNFYSWGVQVKNNYSKAVQFEYKLFVGNENPKRSTMTYMLKPGETYANDMGTGLAIIVSNNSDQYRIEVSKVCFEGQDCNKNGYADCNGNQSKTEIKENQKSNSVQNNIDGIKESTSNDGKMKFVTDYKDGKKINAKHYREGILETIFLYDAKGNVIESTNYYPSGEVFYHKICKAGSCHTIYYEKDGNVQQKIDSKPFDWKN